MPVIDESLNLYTLQIRDAKTALTPNSTQRTTLIIAGVYIIVIAILWHVPYLNLITCLTFSCRLLTVGFHEMSHAIAGVLTCARIHSLELDPDEGGATRMSGGIPWITLPAGYLGSSLIGACLIACGFDTNASKVASLVLAAFFLVTLWCLCRTWALIFGMSALIVLFWFVAGGVALRYLVLFIGVMSCLYVVWDVIDDTIARKVNESDASAFAQVCGCCPSQVWGVIWLIIALMFFVAGVLVGIVAFKDSNAKQKEDSLHFIPVPGAKGNSATSHTVSVATSILMSSIAVLLA
ncbi:peptidase M50B-like-domain-containing protein [Hysterangium stoloniferum]|nr:peptidase M50B-like-domain-containing protein [Hysterangium stoloniferum]